MKLFFAADADIELWPHFKAHYEEIGVTDFFCVSSGGGLTCHKNLIVFDVAFDPQLHYFKNVQNSFSRMVSDFVVGDEWYMIAELDEFHNYGRPLSTFLADADRASSDCVLGVLIDRVAADGGLPELNPRVALDEQFPMTSRITQNILDGCRQKVVAAKGRHVISGGNHVLLSPHRAYKEHIKVNHFKWHRNILSRMKARLSLADNGSGWMEGTRRVLQHWEAKRSVLV